MLTLLFNILFLLYTNNSCTFTILVLLFNNLAMLYFNLKPILTARQIEKPYSFLVKIGISPNTAHKILNDSTHVMRLDNLERICAALYCEPNDLLAFKPESNNPLPQNHPLNNLMPHDENNDWQQKLKTLPLSKLKQITQIISQNDNAE
jgi:DNA-binding Xre family transcriptional regulator